MRQNERLAAAQAEQIGIALTDLYPAFFINGNLGWTAANFPDLFKNAAFNGTVGPSFQWNVLNYGRIINNVRYQDADSKSCSSPTSKACWKRTARWKTGWSPSCDRSGERNSWNKAWWRRIGP